MKNLRRVYELTAIGVKENRDSAKEIKGMSETIYRISQDVSDNGAAPNIWIATCVNSWAELSVLKPTSKGLFQ